MYPNFEKLSKEKKQSILSICIEEFGKTGFEKTSTDTITTRAGISKGILFHYFKNKKNLFLYVIDYCRQLIGNTLMEELEKLETDDFFERIKEVVLTKLRVQLKYSQETNLVANVLLNPPVGLKEEVQELLQKNVENYSDQYLGKLLDPQLLKNHASPEKVVNLTMLALEQITQKYIALYQNKRIEFEKLSEQMIPEIDEYIELIKYGCIEK
ncbi:TetR/AcrR family transcriptional regulator [Sutcliffiella horikoshii]|uniref:TetR/AcrR family transcriptional regulator n=1 Tax=Sutcliffiella horikoshii TaxID=79883 RepID=A0A5D4SMX4_9BACI|nr:TetR/AcrR family transcriptional regulator [Sutcliffiella horikoshii]TYS63664.1 TetR/AcrR family transcriptional regulator [Sutcliffiella horikoshii]